MQHYQPLSGLHDPRIVDIRAANLPGLRVDVYCVPGKYMGPLDSRTLCRNVRALLENQGAEVETYTRARSLFDLGGSGSLAIGDEAGGPADLVVELRARRTHKDTHALSWVWFALSFGIVPGYSEHSFEQEIVVRDGDGYLLAQKALEGRMVVSMGLISWGGNKLLDWTVREPEEELTGDAGKRALSDDLYGQLSQVVFDARLRREVLQVATEASP